MKKFSIHLTHSAAKDLESITAESRSRIVGSIKSLAIEPSAPALKTKKLRGFKPPPFRIRSGDHRILYRVQEGSITILRVVDRKDLETIIKRLKEEPAAYE